MTLANHLPAPLPDVRRFVPRGIAAIDPQALALDYGPLVLPEVAAACESPAFCVVDIRGALAYEFSAPQYFQTYDMIGARFDCALAQKPKAIVLRIASPGGDVSGSFDLARRMRKAAEAAGVKLIAFTEAQACSAAYVLACAADEIVCTDTAALGSIGVIVQPVDTTAAEAAAGMKFAVISSGERKADGNPHVALSEEARAAIQQTVDTMAEVFFQHVGANRPALTAAKAKALQAGVRIGYQAVEDGLADRISTFAELCDGLSAKAAPTGGTILESDSAASAALQSKAAASMAFGKDDDKDKDEKPKEDAVRASLVTASTSDDEKKAARAKAALAAYDSDEGEDDKKKKDDEKAKAIATATANAHQVTLAEVAAQATAAITELRQMKAAAETLDRAAVIASRPDLPKATFAALGTLCASDLRAVLATFPIVANPLAPVTVAASTGNPGVHMSSPLSAAETAELDRRFGLTPIAKLGTTVVGAIQTFGVPVATIPGVAQ